MESITLHHYDAVTGRYLGTTASPPRPEGVGLPAHCTLAAPPGDVPEGCAAVFEGGGWSVQALPPEPEPGPSLAEAQARAVARINASAAQALAWLVAGESLTGVAVAVEAALWAASDPESLQHARDIIEARRAELVALVQAAGTVAAVADVAITFPA